MKLKLKNKLPSSQQQSTSKKMKATQNSSWEMSAESALRVDYVTRYRNLPFNHN